MSDNDEKVTQQPDENVEPEPQDKTDEDTDTSTSVDEPEEVTEHPAFKKLASQKAKWRDKAVDATSGKEWKTLYEESTKKDTPVSDVADKSDIPVRDVLKLRNEGFNDAEILDLADRAAKYKIPIPTLLDDPMFKAGIEAERQKKKVAQGTPSVSSRTGTTVPKDFAKLKPSERAEKYSFQAWKAKKQE